MCCALCWGLWNPSMNFYIFFKLFHHALKSWCFKLWGFLAEYLVCKKKYKHEVWTVKPIINPSLYRMIWALGSWTLQGLGSWGQGWYISAPPHFEEKTLPFPWMPTAWYLWNVEQSNSDKSFHNKIQNLSCKQFLFVQGLKVPIIMLTVHKTA